MAMVIHNAVVQSRRSGMGDKAERADLVERGRHVGSLSRSRALVNRALGFAWLPACCRHPRRTGAGRSTLAAARGDRLTASTRTHGSWCTDRTR